MTTVTNTMNPNKPTNRAVAALNSLLTQVSAITLKDMGLAWPVASAEGQGREIDILAHVEVFGHGHTLACQISAGSGTQQVRTILEELHSHIAFLPGNVTPVLILPVLSPEVQALCDENKTGCIDLHGNGRLVVDQAFISVRSLPRKALRQSVTASPSPSLRCSAPVGEERSGERVLRGFPPVRSDLARQSATHARTH